MTALQYLDPSSTQTLRQGIAELKRSEGPEGDAAENVSTDLILQIDVHDAIHVLFACPTDLRGEIAAHVWTAFGTTMTIAEMHNVNRHRDHRQVLREIGHLRVLRTWIQHVPLFLSIAMRSRRMTAKWPAERYRDYLDVSLFDLREQFKIQLAQIKRPIKSRGGAGLRRLKRTTA